MRAPAVVLSLLLIVASSGVPLGAQAPDCNLAAKRHDAGLTLRRYQFHAARATAAIAGATLLHKTLTLPAGVSSLVPATISLGLHAVGASRGWYRVNAKDWSLDALVTALPAFYLLGRSGHSWQATTLSLTTFTAGYFALACFASP